MMSTRLFQCLFAFAPVLLLCAVTLFAAPGAARADTDLFICLQTKNKCMRTCYVIADSGQKTRCMTTCREDYETCADNVEY